MIKKDDQYVREAVQNLLLMNQAMLEMIRHLEGILTDENISKS